MSDFNLGQFINKFADYALPNTRGPAPDNAQKMPPPPETFSKSLLQNQQQQSLVNSMPNNLPKNRALINTEIQMNHLESLEKALYVKDLMNLPKDLSTLLQTLQKSNALVKNMPGVLANINLNDISLLLQQNGKEAMNKLIFAMSNASKQGITDTSQLKDIMKLINASISTAGENNSAQTLKSLMLLYLPWLPLQDGTGFELEIGCPEDENKGSDSTITILISTKNYGNVHVTLILNEANSVNIIVNCLNVFPKQELLKKLQSESNSHSIQSNIIFEEKEKKQDNNAQRQAKVSVSNTNDVNPFLLLMANAVIKYTIELDIAAG